MLLLAFFRTTQHILKHWSAHTVMQGFGNGFYTVGPLLFWTSLRPSSDVIVQRCVSIKHNSLAFATCPFSHPTHTLYFIYVHNLGKKPTKLVLYTSPFSMSTCFPSPPRFISLLQDHTHATLTYVLPCYQKCLSLYSTSQVSQLYTSLARVCTGFTRCRNPTSTGSRGLLFAYCSLQTVRFHNSSFNTSNVSHCRDLRIKTCF